MAKIPRTSVVLVNEYRELFKNDSASIFLKDGRYFNCDLVEQNGYFLDMTISFSQTVVQDKRIENKKTLLSIPAHFVLYMVSGDARKNLGFSKDE